MEEGLALHDTLTDPQLSDAERLARAVLLFHRGGPWTAWDIEVWRVLTGESEATTRALCDLARRVRKAEEERNAK
jgi:hypothetical protein